MTDILLEQLLKLIIIGKIYEVKIYKCKVYHDMIDKEDGILKETQSYIRHKYNRSPLA